MGRGHPLHSKMRLALSRWLRASMAFIPIVRLTIPQGFVSHHRPPFYSEQTSPFVSAERMEMRYEWSHF